MRFFVQNFGCRATQADGAALEQQLCSRGLVPAGEASEADLVVLNTCTVTAAADEDARHAIRRLRRDNPSARILVTGCYAQRAPQELASISGVSWVVGNSHKSQIGDIVATPNFVPAGALAGAQAVSPALPPAAIPFEDAGEAGNHAPPLAQIITGDIFAHTELAAAPVFGAGSERTRPNLKIQDGCNNKCSFCIIPSVRGRSRSLPRESVLEQVGELERRGYREIVLSGINLGRWGRDLRPRHSLASLIRALLDRTTIERLRLSSVEPLDFSDELLELMAASPRLARHVHAPLQSGSDRVLRLMYRRYRARHYEERIRRAFALMPEAAFGADVMVGFPGETDEDFEQTRALVERLPFTYLHVFTYSRREGTVADASAGQVNGRAARKRSQALRELAAAKNHAFRQSQVGRCLSVITLSDGAALSSNYLKVRIADPPLSPNQLLDVRITGLTEDGLLAHLAAGLPEPGAGGAETKYSNRRPGLQGLEIR